MDRAAIYIRVSSEEQVMHGLSLQAQRDSLAKYAKDHSMKIVDVYADEGITARKKYRNRIQFMRMLDDVRAGKIDVILFIKLDRWFRNVSDYYEIQRILDENKVEWISTEERYDTTTANGRLNLNIKLSIAQDESDRTSERIKFVFQSKVKRGEIVSGKVPLGYRIEEKHMVPDDQTAGIARDIFNQYINLQSIRALRKYAMDKYGLVYSHGALKHMFLNERYIGKAHGIDDFCEPIIERRIFELASSIASRRAQRNSNQEQTHVYLFSGLVYCAECGNRLSVHTVDGYVYYRCTRYEKLHQCSHRKHTSELVLERWLLANLEEQCAKYNSEINESKLAKKEKPDEDKILRKMEKLKDLYLNDLIGRDVYERDYTELKNMIEATGKPEEIREPVDIPKISEMLAVYRDSSRSNKKVFWNMVLQKIIITVDDGFTVVLR